MKLLSQIHYLLVFLLIHVTVSNAETVLPTFTPNVVDPYHLLTNIEKEEINITFDTLRSNDIWAAVYLTDRLREESIESLAERAFRKWELGEREKDNGLLLILVMNDRQSRFEVGYGLEGDLTELPPMMQASRPVVEVQVAQEADVRVVAVQAPVGNF